VMALFFSFSAAIDFFGSYLNFFSAPEFLRRNVLFVVLSEPLLSRLALSERSWFVTDFEIRVILFMDSLISSLRDSTI